MSALVPASSPVPSARHKHTGVCPAARGGVLAGLIHAQRAPVWLVVADTLRAAEQLAEDTALFHPALAPASAATAAPGRTLDALILPESLADSRDMAEAFAASADRQSVLSRLRATRQLSGLPADSAPLVVFTTPAALLQRVPALEAYAATELTLRRGETHPFAALLEKLRALDYDSEAVCEAPGTYAVRGGIIDLYPVNAAQPCRLDFFGDELEDIRLLDPVTQRSGDALDSLTLAASPRLSLAPSLTGLAPYLSSAARIVLVEPASLDATFSLLARENPQASAALAPLLGRVAALEAIADLDESAALFDTASGPVAEITWDTESLAHHRRYPSDDLIAQDRLAAEEAARRDFLDRLGEWSRDGAALAIITPREAEEKRIREILDAHPAGKKLRPVFLRGQANEGFRLAPRPGAALALASSAPARRKRPAAEAQEQTQSDPAVRTPTLIVVTETELFGRSRARRPATSRRATVHRAQVDQLLDFAELAEGDFVVHLQHGVALFRGITKLDTRDGPREVISLEFDDRVTLHVPLPEAHLVSRYVGLSKVRPQLGRIGSDRWQKTRAQAERATVDLAAELLRIQAARDAQPGVAIAPDNDWQREFEGAFPFAETPDQVTAITATKLDQERARPMDRLVCGDVGFGKTEVAIRAAFKAVQSGKQVAILVPTTILAQQHLNTFRERMAGYPVAVEMLSRFRSRAESVRIVAATAAGQVDILIGTHRLLNKDISFKDLGLVVIDEEQRFGVKHKEKLKALRVSVDVLSMSATPIPRTLYMAMTGARDMSVIETPPTNRHPIQTIVKTYDEQLVVDAIRHELRRGGQVFYLHNRVQTIGHVAARLRELLPDVDIGVGHGQMDEHELEEMMTAFVAGRHQVLVCTTIIETGLDIPNCNTIIIEGADRFGLSQLYQLRGRVGRFKHQAYAYLLLHRHSRLVDIARERLNALRTHNQLGAGFRIAMRDLELRGAGNLLGSEQSGHIVGVGFELYCQLLRQSVARLKGDKQAAAIRATVKLDFVFVGEGESASRSAAGPAAAAATSYQAIKAAHDEADAASSLARIQARLPVAYIGETRLRLDFYRRLALAGSPATLKELEAELTDRFGKFNSEVRALLQVTGLRIAAEQKGIVSVETEGAKLKLLRAGPGRRDDYVQLSGRFPRLTAPKPLARLAEILVFLNNLPAPRGP